MTDERISQTELEAIRAEAKAEGKAEAEAEAEAAERERKQRELVQTVFDQADTIVTLATQCDELAKAIGELRSGQLSKESINKVRLQIVAVATSVTGIIQGALALFGG